MKGGVLRANIGEWNQFHRFQKKKKKKKKKKGEKKLKKYLIKPRKIKMILNKKK